MAPALDATVFLLILNQMEIPLHRQIANSQTEKKRTLAVRETGISWHNGSPIKVPPEALQYHSAMMFEIFQEMGGRYTDKASITFPFKLNGI